MSSRATQKQENMAKFEVTKISSTEDSFFDRQERIDWWEQDKLQHATILVVGAGAIGNETLKNLALLGVGNILITDFDDISKSNLSRTVLFRKGDEGKRKAQTAAERIKEMALSDDFKVNYFEGDVVWELGTGVYRHVDIVLGCLDNIETRIAVNKQCYLAGTPWIDAGIYELGLRINFYQPPHAPCYQCSLSPNQWQAARERYSCDDFKKQVVSEGKIPTVQIASALVGALQVQEAVKFLCGQDVAVGKQIYYQGKTNDFDVFDMPENPDCWAHQASYDEIISLDLDTDSLLKDFLKEISKDEHSGEGATLDFRGDRTFVKNMSCRTCQKQIEFYRPSFRIFDYESHCEECRSEGKNEEDKQTPAPKQTVGQFNLETTEERLLNFSLKELGVPILHVVAVQDIDGKHKYYELTGDKKKLFS